MNLLGKCTGASSKKLDDFTQGRLSLLSVKPEQKMVRWSVIGTADAEYLIISGRRGRAASRLQSSAAEVEAGRPRRRVLNETARLTLSFLGLASSQHW
ncbi:hypothetical protein P4204_09825 [Pseudomonas aeruginosa]|nr:hypothetical protein [Pseudomonas aeruginosa]